MDERKFRNTYRIKSTRLEYDNYLCGGYFVTICVSDHMCLLGDIKGDQMIMNQNGQMADAYWKQIPQYFPNVSIDKYIVMPNHIHGIVLIHYHGDAINGVSTSKKGGIVYKENNPMINRSLSTIIRWYKGRTAYEMNKSSLFFKWQPRFHDHIIRNEQDLMNIRQYIENNPKQWHLDEENPLSKQ